MKNFAALVLITHFWCSLAFGEPGVNVRLSLSPAGSFQAKGTKISGSAKKEGSKVIAQGITVDLNDLSTGISLRDDHMKNKYLDVKNHPTAELTTGTGENELGKGKIKIKGIEKEIEGTYKINGKELEATFKIKLSEFDIKGIRYLGVGVKDDAEVNVTIPIQ